MATSDNIDTKSGTEQFEDNRWRSFTQALEFRHQAALSLVTQGPVLDIGCGDGLLLALLRERGIEAEGADISQEAVARCKERGLQACVYDPAHPLPYPDNSFECVVLLDVLEHVYDPVVLLAEARRISRSEIVIGVPNFSSFPARIQVLLGGVPENNQPHKGHVYWFNRDVLRSVARDAGLRITAWRMNTFMPFRLLGNSIVRLAPRLLALSFVVRLEREVYDTVTVQQISHDAADVL